MASASASHGQSSYDTGSITPLSARAAVPTTVHHHPVMPCASWTTIPNTNGFVVTTSSAPHTAPQLQNHQQAQAQQHHHTVFASMRTSVPTAWSTVTGDSVAVNARSSTRQLQVFPTTAHGGGHVVGVVAAPQPPSSLLLHHPVVRARVPTSPVTMGSPVLRTQPRRLP
mmetsp:Transcript_47780/g.94974  ORF Transcript_47780/g.94974 Transcript_47780/m.94974 type:complete len:169 (+) Transcript_47780:1755-2261(+)